MGLGLHPSRVSSRPTVDPRTEQIHRSFTCRWLYWNKHSLGSFRDGELLPFSRPVVRDLPHRLRFHRHLLYLALHYIPFTTETRHSRMEIPHTQTPLCAIPTSWVQSHASTFSTTGVHTMQITTTPQVHRHATRCRWNANLSTPGRFLVEVTDFWNRIPRRRSTTCGGAFCFTATHTTTPGVSTTTTIHVAFTTWVLLDQSHTLEWGITEF